MIPSPSYLAPNLPVSLVSTEEASWIQVKTSPKTRNRRQTKNFLQPWEHTWTSLISLPREAVSKWPLTPPSTLYLALHFSIIISQERRKHTNQHKMSAFRLFVCSVCSVLKVPLFSILDIMCWLKQPRGPFSPWHNLSALVIKGFQQALSELIKQYHLKRLAVIRMLDICHLVEALAIHKQDGRCAFFTV